MFTYVLSFFYLLILLADPTPILPAKLDRKEAVDFAKEVAPILAAKCISCHTGKVIEGDYEMTTLAMTMKGGKRGPAIVPNKPAESWALNFAAHRKKPIMPPKSDDNPLTANEVALLERWIEEGAKGDAEFQLAKAKRSDASALALSLPSRIVSVRAVAVNFKAGLAFIGKGKQLSVYDANKGDLIRTFIDGELKNSSHASIIESMAISSDGKTVATGSFQAVTLWDVSTGKAIHKWKGFRHSIVALAFSPDNRKLATAGGTPTEDGEVKLFDSQTGAQLLELKQPHTDTVYGIAFRPDGKQLLTSSADKFVKLFDLQAGQLVRSFEGHTQHVLDVAWRNDGLQFVSAGADGLIKIWDADKGEKVKDVLNLSKQVTRLVSLKNSQTIFATTSEGLVKTFNVESGGSVKSFVVSDGFVCSCGVDGDWIIAGSEDGKVKLFEIKSGKELKSW